MNTTHMPPDTPEVTEQKNTMTPKSRNALLRYMAILFAVAFIIVTISLVISMHTSQNTITALNQASASALQNAEQLQSSNRDLSDENEQLRQQISELEAQLDEVQTTAENAASAEERAKQTEKAYNLLLQAMTARNNGDYAAFTAAMEQLAPLQDYLQDTAAALYAQYSAA